MSACPFCAIAEPAFANDGAVAVYDTHPVTDGHLLVVPRRHVANWFDCTEGEHAAILRLLVDARGALDRRLRPDGYNVGVNVGTAAGQTVMHVHVHLIPRFVDPSFDPRGGVRGVIPSKRSYPSGR